MNSKKMRRLFETRCCEHAYHYHLLPDSKEADDRNGGYRHYRCDICGAEYAYHTAPMVYEVNPKTKEQVTRKNAGNPYLPAWEHVPDAEPHVFWSKKDREWRVYVYGSHDTTGGGNYCGNDYVTWSAPVYDLGSWRCEGVIFKTEGHLFAPDAAYDVLTDTWYLVTYEFEVRIGLYRSEDPGAYFKEMVFAFDKSFGEFGPFACLDPCIFIEGGRIYLGGSRIARFSTHLPEKIKEAVKDYHQSMSQFSVIYQLKENPKDGVDRISWCPTDERPFMPVYEGVSLRKDPVSGRYIMLYCSTEYDAKGVNSLAVFSTLAYAYTENIMGTWHFGNNGFPESVIHPVKDEIVGGNKGNVILDTGGRYRRDARTGRMQFYPDKPSYPYDNNHGGIARINGRWYVFGHRFTGRAKGARQGILAPLDLSFDKETGAVKISPAEMTSFGPLPAGNPFREVPAYRACWLTSAPDAAAHSGSGATSKTPIAGPYIRFANQDRVSEHASCIMGITSGSTIGFTYYDFGNAEKNVSLRLLLNEKAGAAAGAHVTIMLDSPDPAAGGQKAGTLMLEGKKQGEWYWQEAGLDLPVSGRHGVFLIFTSNEESKEEICDFDALCFDDLSMKSR